MASITGLANIKNLIDRPRSESGPKARWLKLEDGQSVKIRFLNEVDADSKNYNTERGLAIVCAEHTNPKDYRRKCVCTMDEEGRCYGCEMNRRDPKAGWKARLRYYTNVLVDEGTDEPYVAIWSQGVGPKSPTTTTIVEYAGDTGSITNVIWRLKRTEAEVSFHTVAEKITELEIVVVPDEGEKEMIRSVESGGTKGTQDQTPPTRENWA